MQRIAYEIFYDYEAMKRSAPLHTELTKQEVENNIASLPTELETLLGDKESTVSIGNSTKRRCVIFVNSEHDESIIDERVIKALQGLSLFGTKLDSTGETVVK